VIRPFAENQSGATAMPQFERPFNSIEELHATELDWFGRMIQSEMGAEVAVPAAMHYCITHKLDVPQHIAAFSVELQCAFLRRDKRARRGRAANSLSRHQQTMRHFNRWDAVREICEKQKEFRKEDEALRSLPNVPKAMLKQRKEMWARVGRTQDDAFRFASKLLKKTDSSGRANTMKASYLRVEHDRRDPTTSAQYHLLSPQFTLKLS
jgi:hypothetical protein